MNRNKRILLIVVIVLNFLNAATNLTQAILSLVASNILPLSLYYTIYYFVSAVGFITSAGLLIYAISHKGQLFRSRQNFYYAAVTISLCLGLLSISSILLIISLFMTDLVWVKPHDDVYFEKPEEKQESKEMTEMDKERKIMELRDLRDRGIITEEEFKQKLLEIL